MANAEAIRVRFLNREAAEVYLLLDFLSGRSDRSLRPTADEQARSLMQAQVHAAVQGAAANPAFAAGADAVPPHVPVDIAAARKIEADLQDPALLILRVMQIHYPIEPDNQNFEADAAFLLRARDVLNSRAAPATGATIAFTSMVVARGAKAPRGTAPRAGGAGGPEDNIGGRGFAGSAYPWLAAKAAELDNWVRRGVRFVFIVLLLTIAISAYTAWGKVMLDTLDAVRRDDTATQQERQVDANARKPGTDGVNVQAAKPQPECPRDRDTTTDTRGLCYRLNDILIRKETTNKNLEMWLGIATFWNWTDWASRWPFAWFVHKTVPVTEASDRPGIWQADARRKEIELQGVALMAVLGNYVMPVLYGLLGSFAFVLRRYHRRLALDLLSPRDLRTNNVRLLLGTLIGGCIGLVYSGSGQAQATGTLALAVTLSTSAIAFLAGYGVDGVFKVLDALIAQVFRVNGTENAPEQAPQK